MTIGNKIMWKRGEIAPKCNFSSFPHYFIYIILLSGVKLHIHLLNVVVQFIVFLTLSTLICRSTDISVSVSPLEFEITRVDCMYTLNIQIGLIKQCRPRSDTTECDIWPRGYKTFFMLNSAKHEIYFAYKS